MGLDAEALPAWLRPQRKVPRQVAVALGYRPVTLITPGHERAMSRFAELGYRPSRIAFNGRVRSARFDGIRSEDLVKVAARRPKITRAIYWTATCHEP